MARKPTTEATVESAHKAGYGMPHKKDHLVFGRDIPQFCAVIVEYEPVAICDGSQRLGYRSSTGFSYMEEVNRHGIVEIYEIGFANEAAAASGCAFE